MNKFFKIALIFFAAFCILTAMVLFVDVQPVGPLESKVGLASLNVAVNKLIGNHEVFFYISEMLGYFALMICVFFGCVGAVQLFKGKSLAAVDRKIVCLGVFYIVVIALYAAFTKIPVSFRPVLEADGTLETSFPSSHTILAVCVFITACSQSVLDKLEKKQARTTRVLLGIVLPIAMIVSRLLSGIHWFTDIVAGVLLSFALVCVYKGVIESKIIS